MTDRAADRSPHPGATESSGPPPTGDEAIDEALRKLADLSDAALPEQHDRLTAAHETLQTALDRPSDPGGPAPSVAQPG